MSALSELADGSVSLIPYCGTPPTPSDLLHRWNFDPILIAALGAVAVIYAIASMRHGTSRELPSWRRACFFGGWALGTLALTSPLCALSVSLFSARVAQHMLLACLVAPLVALSKPVFVLRSGAAPRRRQRRQALPAAMAFAVALWVWHAPGPYLATFRSDGAYWLMHLSLFVSAVWLWSALLDSAREGLVGFVGASVLTTVQMGLLGAIITFSGHALYAPHAFTTRAWGLTPLEDQALGGVVMWAPAGAIFVGALIYAFMQAMARAEARAIGRLAA